MMAAAGLPSRPFSAPVKALARPSALSADVHLARILELASSVVPGLDGRQEVSMCSNWAQPVDRDGMSRLYRYWMRSFPEAGTYYAALRAWIAMVWQPIYLCVIAAHLDTHVPRLTGWRQRIENGTGQAFIIPAHEPVQGEPGERIATACAELTKHCQSARQAIQQVTALHDRAMDGLQAECVLGALLCVRRHAGEMKDEDMVAFAQFWLEILGMPGACDYFFYSACNGEPSPALDRKVCCHHFRRRDGAKCLTCPKLSREARIQRLLEQIP